MLNHRINAVDCTLLIDSPQIHHSRPSIMHTRVVRWTGSPAGSAACALLGSCWAHASHMCMCMHVTKCSQDISTIRFLYTWTLARVVFPRKDAPRSCKEVH